MTATQKGPLSINEFRFYVTRAAVGAGLPFGLAEDATAALAARAATGPDPTAQLVRALIGFADDTASSNLSVENDTANRRLSVTPADTRPISALFAGPVIGDWIRAQTDSSRITVSGDHLTVEAGSASLQIGPLDVVELAADMARQSATTLTQAVAPDGIYVDAESWAIIEMYFRKVLVPSSDASRLSGAGAGLLDED